MLCESLSFEIIAFDAPHESYWCCNWNFSQTPWVFLFRGPVSSPPRLFIVEPLIWFIHDIPYRRVINLWRTLLSCGVKTNTKIWDEMQCMLARIRRAGHFHYLWSPAVYPNAFYNSAFCFLIHFIYLFSFIWRGGNISLAYNFLNRVKGTEDANRILSNDAACPICDQVLSKR